MRPRRQTSRTLKLSVCFLTLALAVVSNWNLLTSARLKPLSEPLPPQTPLVIAPNLPSDIPGGAQSATLQQAATFAWQEFFALNWPAKTGVRDTADNSKKFGDQSGPLVWHTYRSKVEIFPGNGYAKRGPHGYQNPPKSPNPPNYGYDDPPQYIYATYVGTTGVVAPCVNQVAPAQPAWINLDEVSQIALDNMLAGVLPAQPQPTNSQPQLIRFLAKANRTQYTYVAQNQYWYNNGSAPLSMAKKNFNDAIRSNPLKAPQSPYVDFPDGTIEVKAAWRQLAPTEDPSRFYMTTVRYYEKSSKGATCYREGSWALIALHIIQKTPSAPSFVFATFEQADNILLPPPISPASPCLSRMWMAISSIRLPLTRRQLPRSHTKTTHRTRRT